jgi:hypothetical protein
MGEQHAQLSLKLRGHYAYYGATNNQRSLQAFREQVRRLWHKWLLRRNRRDRVTWEIFARLEKRFPLPNPHTVHSVYALAAKP